MNKLIKFYSNIAYFKELCYIKYIIRIIYRDRLNCYYLEMNNINMMLHLKIY